MKSKLLFCIAFACYLFNVNAQGPYTPIPDSNFEMALALYDDIPNDHQVPTANISSVLSLDVSGQNISDLTGIQDFTALTTLSCYDNQLNSLHLSNNTNLNYLYCYNNNLTELDVSKNTALIDLWCGINNLSELNVSFNTNLDELNCFQNNLSSLDLTTNTSLTFLRCDFNQLTSLDVSNNTALVNLWCYSNDLSSLDVSANTSLTLLRCHNNQLTALDVSNNTDLVDFRCDSNELSTLDVSNNTQLQTLFCYDNQLTSLDVSQNMELRELLCGLNPLTSMDLSTNTSLEHFRCPSSNLSSLNIKNGNNYNVPDENFVIHDNADLYCVEVDDAAFSSTTWITNVDAQVEFNEYSCEDFPYSDYVILAEEEVELKLRNRVLSGNVGVTDHDGEAEFRWFSYVAETVEAADIYVSNTSSVGNQVLAPAQVDLPEFMENNVSNSNSPNVTVNSYQTVELNGSNYGRVKVKKGGTVVFTNSNIHINELKGDKNITVSFTQCANVLINKSLKFNRNTTFNDLEQSVFVYVDDKIQIKESSNIRALMYANNSDLKVSAKLFRPTYMKGLFIGEKVKGDKNVIWNKDEDFSPCSLSNTSNSRLFTTKDVKESNNMQLKEISEEMELISDEFSVKTWPVPSNNSFNVKVNVPGKSENVMIRVYDVNGRLVHLDSFDSQNSYIFGESLQSGIYIVKYVHASNVKTVRVVKN